MSLEDLTPAQLKALQLGQELLNNPEVKNDALRLAKKSNPKLIIPEIELEDRIAASAKAANDRADLLEADLMKERVARRKTERDAQIRESGHTVENIEAIIVREKCSYETALKIADLEARTADPGPADVQSGHAPGTHVEMRPEKEWRGLSGAGLRKRSAEIARDVINEFRGSRRSAAR